MNELVARLSREQPIVVTLRPDATLPRLRAACAQGFVHLTFVETGTELGVHLEPDACAIDFDAVPPPATGTLVGTLILDYVRARCRASIDLATMAGRGHLEVIEETTPAELARQRTQRALA